MTTLRCSEYTGTYTFNQCTRQPVNQWQEKGRDSEAELNNLLCNFHAGHKKRGRYQNPVHDLTDADRERLLPLQAEKEEERAKERQAQQDEAAQRALRDHADSWSATELTASHALVPAESSSKEEPTFVGEVWTDERTHSFDRRHLQVEPNVRTYGAATELPHPYIIRVTRGGNLTPNEARELAALLVEAAAKAEDLNKDRY